MTDQRDGALPPPTEASFDLRALYVRFRRRLPIFLGVVGAIMAAVLVYTFTQPKGYTATANVLIEPRQLNVLSQADVVAGLPTDSASIDTQVQVISSRAIAEHVVERLELDKDRHFSWALDTAANKSGGVKGFLKSLFRAAAPQTSAGSSTLDAKAKRLEPIIDVVQGQTRVRRSGLTYVIEVSYTAGDPVFAAKMANAVAEQYLIDQVEAKLNATRGANDWLTSRLNTLQVQVERDEAAVQRYKIAHNLLSSNGATMAEQEVSTLNQQIASAKADLAEKEARLSAAQSQLSQGGGGGDIAAVLGSDVIRDLRSQKAAVTRRQAELLTRYGPRHPDVQKVQQELADLDQSINQEIARQISNLKAEVDIARQRTSSLEASRSHAQGALASNNSSEVDLMELERKAEASRAVYEAFLNRSKETSAAEGTQTPDAQLSSPATPPDAPSKPNIKINLALGLVLSLVAGLGVVILVENLDSGLRTSSEVETLLNVPSVGAVPLIPANEKVANKFDYILNKPFSAFSEAFRNLKASLLFSRSDRPIRVISISSALPGEGKTLTTLSLGRSMASSGSKVVIIDGDLRRHMLTAAMNVAPPKGFVELLQGEASLDEVLFLDEASGASFIFCSSADTPIADVIGGGRLAEVFEELKSRFDYVLVDTAPVLAVADTRVLAANSDVVLFLTKWAKTPRQAVMASIDLLLNAGAYLGGVCLTQIDLAQQSRLGYGDKLYYYQAYKKYYSE
ncbi:GumC family protein [Phenylobacterium sp.]|uniref:GumC family protein n=1 Tax=Phenylobacterium sp. TaxID=1871053 RepID=UPI0035B02198